MVYVASDFFKVLLLDNRVISIICEMVNFSFLTDRSKSLVKSMKSNGGTLYATC